MEYRWNSHLPKAHAQSSAGIAWKVMELRKQRFSLCIQQLTKTILVTMKINFGESHLLLERLMSFPKLFASLLITILKFLLHIVGSHVGTCYVGISWKWWRKYDRNEIKMSISAYIWGIPKTWEMHVKRVITTVPASLNLLWVGRGERGDAGH